MRRTQSIGSDIFAGPPDTDRDARAAPGAPQHGALTGRHIALTWSVGQDAPLAVALEAAGARVSVLFACATQPVEGVAALDAALADLADYDWIVLTSVAAVDVLAQRLAALGRGWHAHGRIHIAQLFPLSARALDVSPLPPDLAPEAAVADDVRAELANVGGKRVLLLRAEHMRTDLAAELRRRGADVRDIAAYRVVPRAVEADVLGRLLGRDAPDALICTGAVTAQGLIAGIAAVGQQPGEALRGVRTIALGDDAGAALRHRGLVPSAVIAGDTTASVLRALAAQLARPTSTAVA